ncbi:MAG: PIN domain-containing protein [Armatimonadetes bacterium]|nr:PIN domain-containing protein [Armatimonadota bacterium]
MKFWDASALIPLCVEEAASGVARDLLRADPDMAVWWGSPVECWSAFARLRREGVLSSDQEDAARERLGKFQRVWVEIEPGEEVRGQAGRVVRLHPLRAADALQLAAALVWVGRTSSGEIVVLDKRIREAARLEGLTPVPGDPP